MNWTLFLVGFAVVLAWGLAYAWACWAYLLGYKRAESIGKAEADSLRAMIRASDRRSQL